MTQAVLLFFAAFSLTLALPAPAQDSARWPADKAQAWYAARPWPVGCNFLPSTAANDVAMWQKESFDEATIARELGWAHDLGFNTVRVFVNYVCWEADPEGLKQRLGRFLELAAARGIAPLVILFDDCFKPEPAVGPQPDPVPGVHNSQWVQSPGVKRRGDPAAWPKLEAYVKDVVGALAQDRRILAWDLYNEPSACLPLVEAAFKWAREAKPSQPLTTCVFGDAAFRRRILELSNVISFHNYGGLESVRNEVAGLKAQGRPVLCTEWMARPAGSRFEANLPYFKEEKVGCWNWGLVAGRTQTYFPWGSPPGAPEPPLWFHDILRRDGTPYLKNEARFIQGVTGAKPPLRYATLVPTAEAAPVPWRYTLEKPAGEWFAPGFDDAAWKTGDAPFGREEPPIRKRPGTEWTTSDIWLRRDFELKAAPAGELALQAHYDEDTEVYLNGVLASELAGYNAAYAAFDIRPAAAATLKPGRNVLAVHCRQTAGGQYLDVGIQAVENAER